MIKESIICLLVLTVAILLANLIKRYRLYRLNKYYKNLLETKTTLEKKYAMLQFEYNRYEL